MKNKKYLAVFGIFALVIVTSVASFAFFTYSRVGVTTTTITSGDIEFSFIEGEDASLANAFPVSDSIGAQDTTEEYTFTVNMKSSATANKMNYNVYLLDANDDENVNYFNNEQIKFALIKNDVYVAGTSSTEGKNLTSIAGFNEGTSEGEGPVLENQEILANTTDYYKLRIWISDEVDYSNTSLTDDETDENNDDNISSGKYNGYKYSLRVKVNSYVEMNNSTISIKNLTVDKLNMSASIEDINGLNGYVITTSPVVPEIDSNEWIAITAGNTATIEYMAKKNGTYYLHIKNNEKQTTTKSFSISVDGELASDFIVNLASNASSGIRIDEHEPTGQQTFATKEYRYWGATVNNYVWFNDELWRIVGLFDVDDGEGKVEQRLKIMRNTSIGELPWDQSSYNQNTGINEWSQADLKILLNEGDYYNRSISYSTIGLTTEAKKMIGSAKWYLGAAPNSEITTGTMYGYERGTITGKNNCAGDFCNDSVTRSLFWNGEVGLIYASDYGYSSDMSKCSNVTLKNFYYSSNYNVYCHQTSWIFNGDIGQWTITPSYYYPSLRANAVFHFLSQTFEVRADNPYRVRPAVYLKSNINIIGGEGTADKPYVLSK